MLTQKLYEAKNDFLRGYNNCSELLINIFDPKESKSDFKSAVNNTRADAMKRSGTIMEDFGIDTAWVIYHCKYPVKAYNYRKSLKKRLKINSKSQTL